MRPHGISVLVRMRDEALTLPLALESVEQIADEIIIVDNLSIDRSFEIAEEFASKASKPVILQKYEKDWRLKEGTAAEMNNMALGLATQEWIMKWDADWYTEPEQCTRLRDTILNCKDKNVHGFVMPNIIVNRSLDQVCKSFCFERGIIKYYEGFQYIDLKEYGFETEIKSQEPLKFDFCSPPYIWHLRMKSAKEFVEGRLTYPYYSSDMSMSFEEFVRERLNNLSYEEMEKGMIGDSFEPIDVKKVGQVPARLKEYFADKSI